MDITIEVNSSLIADCSKGFIVSTFLDEMISKARSDKKTIVLAEGNDQRTLDAAKSILDQEIAELIILGDRERILDQDSTLNRAQIMDPQSSDLHDVLADELYQIRKAKGLSQDDASKLIDDELYFGVMLVKTGRADGMVAGACHSTGDVLRPSLQILKTAPGAALVSSFFIMVVPNCEYGDDGTFLFADCGLNVNTDSESLANIAVSSARSWRSLIGTEPFVAMLSHSTYCSAKNDDANKVVEATRIARALDASIELDGELQLDAAICQDVARSKCASSSVAGKANVLIFPDLDAGNIGYKLVQRLAKAEAYGPVTQGLAKPVNDLSRGCSANDIVGVVAITCVQAQSLEN